MKKSRACFADGGQISKADQLIAEMNAKYGIGGGAPAATVQQPAPQPKPQPAPPQQPERAQGIIGILKGRQQQIDKASGYANGGLIEGIGTPTSDSIPAKVRETGEDIAVSTKERIVSHEQDKLLQRLAKAMGFDSVDAFFEAGTGKPVGPTIKGGKRAAKDGADLKKPWYMQDPLTALSSGIEKSMNASQAAEDYNKSLYPAGTFDSATKPTPQQSATGNPLSSVSPTYQQSRPGASDVGLAGIGNKPSTASTADNQFTQGGKNYTVNPTSQDGIKRVTGGTSPLYTNIDPAQGVAGLKNQMIGGDAASVNEGLSRHANANRIRGEMIDSMVKTNGGNGIAVMPEAQPVSRGMSISDIQAAMKSAGTRTERAAYGQMLNTALNNQVQTRGQDLNYSATMAGQGITARGQDMNNERAIGHDQVIMRGQDINAQTDAKRLGIVQTAEERAADRWNVERPGIVAQAKDADAVRSARQGLMDAVASGDPKAIEKARTTAVAAGIKFDKPADNFDFKTGPMGNVAVQQLPDGGASITTFGIDGKPKPAVTIPAPGAQQPAGGKRVGNSPYDEGFQLVGKDGKNYVVRNGQPVLAQ